MPACPLKKHRAVSLPWWERLGLRWGSAMGSAIPACPLPAPGSREAQGRLSPPRLDLRRGFSRGKRLREGIGVASGSVGVGGSPPAWLRLSFPNGCCCGQGLRAGDALCWRAGSGHRARLWEHGDSSRGEAGTPTSPATPATGVTGPTCQTSKTSCLPELAERAASYAGAEGGKTPTGMGPCGGNVGSRNPARGWGRSPGSGWQQHRGSGQAAAGSPVSGGSRGAFVRMGMCVPARLRRRGWAGECVSPQFGAAPGALSGLSEPARGAAAASPAAATAGEITSR